MERPGMRVGVVVGMGLRGSRAVAREVCKLLLDSGAEVYVYPPIPDAPEGVRRAGRVEDMHVDYAISIGGDGTVLRTFLFLPDKDTPVLGIGLGEKSFLSVANRGNYVEAVRKFLSGDFTVREEMRLEVSIEGGGIELPPVLNDVVFASRITGKTCDLHLGLVEGGSVREVWRTKGDGVIIATPVGSTAYARSAGGPVLDLDLEGIVIVPIVPVDRKPAMVVRPDRVVCVWAGRPRSPPLLILDGQIRVEVDYDRRVYVRRSRKGARFIVVGGYSTVTHLAKASA
ncbi:hypothetical protein B6U99_03050 [Candidatus Geothermarchaeota archaeon ex4572_27]|nr:MAG: hypothetical protein B6U99_03050 [Candidatus Geothermarchaeota archaeon ex4572_27]